MAISRAPERALHHVMSLVEQRTRTGTPVLPPVRMMAAQAGVSVSVLWRVVRDLRDKGILLTRQGSGIRIALPDTPAHTPPPRGQKWEKVREQLSHDILLGRFAPGSALPPTKELAEHYGVAYRTFRKAAGALVSTGVITGYRSGYRVPYSGGSQRYNGALVVIARGAPGSGPVAVGPRTIELFHLLEDECARARVSLSFAPYDYVHGRLHAVSAAPGQGRRAEEKPLGVIVLTTGVQNPDPSWPDNLLSLAPMLARHVVPVVFIDETGERLDAVSRHLGGRLTVVSMSHSPAAGAAVGHRLRALGHRRVAYLSAYHESAWSRNRLAGLASAYAKAGADCSVTAFTRGDVMDAAHIRPLRDAIAGIERRLSADCLEAGTAEDRAMAAVLADENTALGDRVLREFARRAFTPLARDAARHPDITAWVCANDTDALSALRFLAAENRTLARMISVVGFDDSPESLSARLTSYNFDCAGAVHAALRHALETPGPARGTQSRVIDIEGYLVQRETLRRNV